MGHTGLRGRTARPGGPTRLGTPKPEGGFPITESGGWASTFRQAPWHGHTWGSGQSSLPVSNRHHTLDGVWGAPGSAELSHRLECIAVSRAQQAVIPDLDNMGRQATQQQPADEFLGTEGAELGLLGLGSGVVEGTLTIFTCEHVVCQSSPPPLQTSPRHLAHPHGRRKIPSRPPITDGENLQYMHGMA